MKQTHDIVDKRGAKLGTLPADAKNLPPRLYKLVPIRNGYVDDTGDAPRLVYPITGGGQKIHPHHITENPKDVAKWLNNWLQECIDDELLKLGLGD